MTSTLNAPSGHSGASASQHQHGPASDPRLPILNSAGHGGGHGPQEMQFKENAAGKVFDPHHRYVIRKAIGTYNTALAGAKGRFVDHEEARRRAATIKRDAVENLDRYLEQFEANVIKNGGHVHWAENADEACKIILDIAKKSGVKHVVKSKSMATEEVHLNDYLEKAGVMPIETDLGEYICQLRHEPPYHIVTPVMHLTKSDIADLFHKELKIPETDQAEVLTLAAREELRQKFVTAVMGITGANFLIADAGMIAITENEGNARLSFSLPDVHVALVGIEKILPRLTDLALFWPMLATSGTGQHLTCYNSLIGGPRRDNETDGPREFHVVLMDNGRSRLFADPEQREAAQCIRCGACLNVCPVFKSVGGHSYGTTYQGPIGSVITPHLRGLETWKHLSYASSLCGNCTEVCPVRIDLAHHLLHNRRNAVASGFGGFWERSAFKGWLWGMKSASRYRWLGKFAGLGSRLFLALRLDKMRWGNPVYGWTKSRTLPKLAKRSFRDWWDDEGESAAGDN